MKIAILQPPYPADATYRRYVLNQLREVLPFSEVPIRLDIHERRGG